MEKRIFSWIGLVIFGGMLIQTFLQLKSSYFMEASLFIAFSAVVYAALLMLKKKNFSGYLITTGAIAAAAVIMIFLYPVILPAH
ncbi:hypothetical protein E2R51_04200 [Jeotgalibacillus sp. S-D1]|uniref:hypothetical protein n=1 Tax=Jeotgalibacillus sp. S-D1 TaxID=2552189 RepID=UPI001059C752|nr:hypothetical protein [Jeotgalibacillus sp. S-D1]TDL34932.1 hypothetical protein E2R51_04200 [Jeotgalibacillus sp. S-D1]